MLKTKDFCYQNSFFVCIWGGDGFKKQGGLILTGEKVITGVLKEGALKGGLQKKGEM